MGNDSPIASVPRIEPMVPAHAAQVLAIYQAGMDEGNATFETKTPSWAEFTRARLPEHRYVAVGVGQIADKAAPGGEAVPGGPAVPGGVVSGDMVLGWVAVSAVSSRCVYAGVVEHSVYVHPAARGLGVGRLLLGALIASTEAAGIWTIQSGIFPENAASLALHRSAGFRVVGRRDRVGRHHGRWRDILLIERRSPAI